MKLGFSLSPGGLLLPYHMGALHCLQYEQVLEPKQSIVAGSSAGSIAAMAYGCGISPQQALEGTIDISDRCATLGRAQGKLLPLLEEQMESLVGDEEFEYLLGTSTTTDIDDNPETSIGIAYTQIFPQRKSYLQRSFDNRQDLFRAVRFSCMFPFFTTPWPCLLDTDQRFPRLMVDGYFSVPRDQFGCHFLCDGAVDRMTQEGGGGGGELDGNGITMSQSSISSKADRTIAISCFPQDTIGMTAFAAENCISPSLSDETTLATTASISNLFRVATQPTSRQELTEIFDLGYQNAERWCRQEASRKRGMEHQSRQAARAHEN
ncbi:patatin-like phospholipase [Nitzschia inconspicua]|uniref:Patatin-like phospholipase n=1 Tax=Nitzschia inconspicua TaxID=303405 RepID=A0A9K3KCS3_9STRA|nr:patatin-like phospholipase [Nitzschia inconspicua]